MKAPACALPGEEPGRSLPIRQRDGIRDRAKPSAWRTTAIPDLDYRGAVNRVASSGGIFLRRPQNQAHADSCMALRFRHTGAQEQAGMGWFGLLLHLLLHESGISDRWACPPSTAQEGRQTDPPEMRSVKSNMTGWNRAINRCTPVRPFLLSPQDSRRAVLAVLDCLRTTVARNPGRPTARDCP